MSTTAGAPSAEPAFSDGAAGAVVLIAALDALPAAVYFLRGPDGEVVWANARARDRGTTRADLPSLDGRALGDVVEEVLASGSAQTLSGTAEDGHSLTAFVRPVRLAGSAGIFLVLEPAEAEPPQWNGFDAQVVEQVQHSLLPPFLPLLPELQLSGSYHRASSVHSAGGDWYDAVPLGRGRLALVIGDAVGHGIPAAGAMSRLRGAMRSSALRDPSPVAVLTALDVFAGQMDDVEGASVFYGVLDATTGRLTYATAGHPGPLVIGADGRARFLPVSPRPPLGSVPGTVTEVAEELLEHGATLVLYSDGAVVFSDGDNRDGRDRLVEVASRVAADPELRGEGSTGMAAAIAAEVHEPGARPDDVAVLVAYRCPVPVRPLRLELPAVPASLPVVRRQVGAWLNSLGMGEQDRVGLMVAVGEACANAAEHAYRDTEPGPMELAGEVDPDGVLTLVIRDRGTWRPPDRDPGDRGRGLLIMRQLVDRVLLRGQDGTTVTLSMQLRHGPEVEEDRMPADAAATVVVDRAADRPLVSVSGVVDVVSAELLRIRLLEASRGGTTPVDLDLSDVTLFSSAAVRVVLAIARIARDEGWRLNVRAAEGGVTRHILEISGLAVLVHFL